MNHRLCTCGLSLLLAWWMVGLEPLTGQDKEDKVQDVAAAKDKAAADNKSPDKDKDAKTGDNVIREQTIYVPYTKLRETFEKDGRGVFLPYEKFQELWRAARGKETAPPTPNGPTGSIITDIESVATVEKDVVRVTAKLSIELLNKGWHNVPLRLGDAAIISAKLGNEPARLAPDKSGFKLLVQNPADKPLRVELSLEYAKAFIKNPGQNSVAFEAPQAPVNRWQIRVPQSGTKITVQPMIAASEIPADDKTKKPAEETVLLAFVGAAANVQIDWTAKAEGASGLAALVNVQAQQEVAIDEGVLRTRATLAYDISRAELSQLVIEVPADQKVVNVFDPNVKQWDVKAVGETQQVTVSLFQPTKGTQSLVIELEKFLADMNQKELSLPAVKCVAVGRQQGIVVVRVAPSLRAEVQRRTGLTQLDMAELPAQLARTKWDFAYRYATLPFDLTLATEKLQPKIRVDELVEAYLEPEQLSLTLFAKYQIERAGVFQLELDIPAGFEIRQVRGHAAAGAREAAVDAHHVQGENKTRLVVNLSQKALGLVGLLVELQKRLDDPNLLTPTGKASEMPLGLPRALTTGIEHASGRLVLFCPESLRVNPVKQTGLRVISLEDAYQGLQSTREGRFGNVRELLAFAFTQQPAELQLSAERRKPFVTTQQLLVARIDSGVVKYEATFFYDIRFSGVKTLRIDVPQELAAQIRNETPTIRERTLEPAPADVADKYVAWTFAGETELFGTPQIRLTWEKKLDELQVGKPLDLTMPQLRPRDVDRASGQLVMTKSESIDIQPAGETKGLRPIDPQHDLMPGANLPDAARAFEFQDEWSLKVAATRYKLEEVKRTSIERAVLRMVVTRSQEISVQAVYRIRSAHQRLAIVLPANFKLDTQPLSLDGKRIALERGDQNELFVPLVGQSADRPFVLELRYTVPGDQRRFDLPQFLDDPAVQKVHLCVFLPKERLLLGANGAWSEEFSWYRKGPFSVQPLVFQTDHNLIHELIQGTNVTDNPAQTFPTDGTQYVYSTLRPEASPAGSLRLVVCHERWLHAILFIVVAAVGVLLTGRRCASRLTFITLLIIALVLSGVFMPTFATQILGGTLFLALLLVGLVWVGELILKVDWKQFIQTVRRPANPFATPAADVREPVAAAATPPTDTGGPAPPADNSGSPTGGEHHG